jgi:hypothetical protein
VPQGLLNGQLATAIFAGFKGKLLKATLWRLVGGDSSGLDGFGDDLDQAPTTWGAEGFTENYDDAYKARAGIPLTDLKVNLFAASLATGVRPQKDDKANIPAGSAAWYQLRAVKTDPATALWVCQAYACAAPPLPS